mmetsp:Transcript_42812/g.64429  ORF Transcript_42812/g.64429 Transcript_42812/m.64429 type:complete len:248 (-) Transcript_42812:612-1355(-)
MSSSDSEMIVYSSVSISCRVERRDFCRLLERDEDFRDFPEILDDGASSLDTELSSVSGVFFLLIRDGDFRDFTDFFKDLSSSVSEVSSVSRCFLPLERGEDFRGYLDDGASFLLLFLPLLSLPLSLLFLSLLSFSLSLLFLPLMSLSLVALLYLSLLPLLLSCVDGEELSSFSFFGVLTLEAVSFPSMVIFSPFLNTEAFLDMERREEDFARTAGSFLVKSNSTSTLVSFDASSIFRFSSFLVLGVD